MPPNRLSSAFVFSLYVPWLLSLVLYQAPITSYIVAWLGSFFIFYQTWFSPSRVILPDLPLHKQIMRPLFLVQCIFAGYMCCTSIFFFLSALGYKYLDQVSTVDYVSEDTLQNIAECQRLALLGHAALVNGILIIQNKYISITSRYFVNNSISLEAWLMRVGIITFAASFIMERSPGLSQFSIGLYNVAIFCGAMVLVKGIILKNERLLIWGGGIFMANLMNASLTGYKEPIIVNFIMIFGLLVPHYKKAVIAVGIPFFVALLYIMPSYSSVIRSQAWHGETTAEEARADALESIFSDDESDKDANNEGTWQFLTGRFSEINMFTEYVKSTPEYIPFYHTEILENSLMSVIPRALWSNKPITELLAMERVYQAGVINRGSKASAKTRPVVDGYLSGGFIGVFIYLFLLGMIAQVLSNKAEKLFGGYEPGCIVFFNGFFQILWRGETMEFLINSVFWSYISMLIVFAFLRYLNFLLKKDFVFEVDPEAFSDNKQRANYELWLRSVRR